MRIILFQMVICVLASALLIISEITIALSGMSML